MHRVWVYELHSGGQRFKITLKGGSIYHLIKQRINNNSRPAQSYLLTSRLLSERSELTEPMELSIKPRELKGSEDRSSLKNLNHSNRAPAMKRVIETAQNTLDSSDPKKQSRKDSIQESVCNPTGLRILSYNLWFREDVAVVARMKAIGALINSLALPDILCFQEVTPLIYSILRSSDWWSDYDVRPMPNAFGNNSYFTAILWRKNKLRPTFASIPFENSIMGRDLKALVFSYGDTKFCVATSHLESPTGKNSLYSAPRRAQCAKATEVLDSIASNIVFIGDMNWTEANDGAPPLPQGW